MQALKKAITIAALTAALLSITPAAHAQAQGGIMGKLATIWDNVVTWFHGKVAEYKDSKGGGHAVPELDPSAAGSAVVLLAGGVAYIASRRREEEEDVC